jgi:hypothetical protein
MTYDIVALIEDRPTHQDIVAAMLAAGPDWAVRSLADGSVLQLCDEAGEPMASFESPLLIQVPGELERVLGPSAADVPTPVWWHEVRAMPREGASELADRYADELVKRLGGRVWRPQDA